MINVTEKLEELNLTLPKAAAPAANYVPYVISGNHIYVAGQIPFLNGEEMHLGKVGENLSAEEVIEAARACALNILAQVDAAVDGDWSRVERCVKLGGFVNCTPEFTNHPIVINGASDLMVAVLGDAGKHARFAVGAASLPRGVAVEIDAIFSLSSS